MVGKSLVVVFLLGVTWAQLDAGQAQAVETFELPPDLQGLDREQAEEFMNRFEAAFKDKCETNGGPDAFGNAENALKNLKPCLEALADQMVLNGEIEEMKRTGSADELFKKYCGKRPQFKSCFNETVKATKSCFSNDEQNSLEIMLNVTDRLAEFVCFKDGDRVALFIAEGGPECLMEKLQSIRACARSTFGEVQLNPNVILEIKFTKKQCRPLAELQSCVVSTFKTCAQPIAANMVESLFKFIRVATPCKDFHKTYETQTKAAVREIKIASRESLPRSGSKYMDFLVKRKLELEVRTAELEIWNRENELNIEHTILTSDVKSN